MRPASAASAEAASVCQASISQRWPVMVLTVSAPASIACQNASASGAPGNRHDMPMIATGSSTPDSSSRMRRSCSWILRIELLSNAL